MFARHFFKKQWTKLGAFYRMAIRRGDILHYFFEDRSHKVRDHIPLSIYVTTDLSYRAHWHTELELAYVESGSIWVCINNDRRKLVAGDLAISTSGDIHYYESNGSNSKMILLIFKPEFFGLAANWPDTRQIPTFFLQEKNHDKIKTILYAILEETQSRSDFYELFIKSRVIELCGSILRYFPTQALDKEQNKKFSKLESLQEILVYIENNYTEEISLQVLAEQFNIDPFNLSKAFNSVTGNNLRTYINTLRVSKAESLILNTNKPLIDIAFECGFNSVRTFNRAYKGINGCAPSTIRTDVKP